MDDFELELVVEEEEEKEDVFLFNELDLTTTINGDYVTSVIDGLYTDGDGSYYAPDKNGASYSISDCTEKEAIQFYHQTVRDNPDDFVL